MGGFTIIRLKNVSEENIKKQNELLQLYKVPKKYRFCSEEDYKEEYKWYLKGEGNWPEHLFPRNFIRDYKDFRYCWTRLGEYIVAPVGALTFDCYFGRMSDRAMHNLGRYLSSYPEEIASVDGSFTTFMERGMTEKQRKIMKQTGLEL